MSGPRIDPMDTVWPPQESYWCLGYSSTGVPAQQRVSIDVHTQKLATMSD